jgi:hypothetical protein
VADTLRILAALSNKWALKALCNKLAFGNTLALAALVNTLAEEQGTKGFESLGKRRHILVSKYWYLKYQNFYQTYLAINLG